jgi:hypothetical protein
VARALGEAFLGCGALDGHGGYLVALREEDPCTTESGTSGEIIRVDAPSGASLLAGSLRLWTNGPSVLAVEMTDVFVENELLGVSLSIARGRVELDEGACTFTIADLEAVRLDLAGGQAMASSGGRLSWTNRDGLRRALDINAWTDPQRACLDSLPWLRLEAQEEGAAHTLWTRSPDACYPRRDAGRQRPDLCLNDALD